MSGQSVDSYYSAIKEAIENGNVAEVVAQARSGLAEHPQESELAKIEVIGLIKQDMAAQALLAIKKARGAKLFTAKELEFEAAYCHFTLGSYDDAKKALKKVTASKAVTHLLAQIAYKSDDYAECVNLYEELLRDTDKESEEYQDLLLNQSAAKAAALQSAQSAGEQRSAEDHGSSYELMFNAATDLLVRGRIAEAAGLLEMAATQARSSLASEGWSQEDIEGEVAPIEAQRGVALQTQGKTAEARAVFSRLLAGKSLEGSARDIVAHNAAVLSISEYARRDIALDRVKRALQLPGSATRQLSRAQRALMRFNMAVVQFSQGQYASARRSLSRLSKSYSDIPNASAGTLSAAISLHLGSVDKALNELATISRSQQPSDAVFATLAAAQVAISAGDNQRALDVLAAWKDRAEGVSLGSLSAADQFARYYFGIVQLIGWLSGSSMSSTAPDAAKHLYTQ
ncbi:hypothetical protein EC988_006967, partial [Linderina pennispora]